MAMPLAFMTTRTSRRHRSLGLWLIVGLILLGGITACKPNPSQVGRATTDVTATTIPNILVGTTPPNPTETTTLTPTPTLTLSPTPTSTPTPLTCLDEGGTIQKGQLTTSLLPDPLEYRVYLPPCYATLLDKRYPVLYLIHGQSYNDDQWDRLGADETADRLIASGEIAPFLIVMPRDRVWTQPSEDKFGEALVQVLVPWIDANYRTLPSRYFRAIGGLSRGASWAVHLGVNYWGVFGAVGAHSLPVFWEDTYKMRRWLDAIPAIAMPRFYIDIGDQDLDSLINSATWFAKLLDERNIPHEWHLNSGRHDEAYWRAHVEQYLRWYAQDW